MPEAESLSIDKIVNKKLLNAGRILNVLLDSNVATTQCLSLDKAEVTGMIAPEGARIVSECISALGLPRELTVAGLIRGGRGMLAEGHTVVRPGDQVVVLFTSGALSKVERLFRK